MLIHHLNCATFCPIGGRLVGRPAAGPARLVCHCLLIESDDGLILIDTGFGLDDVAHPERMQGALRKLGRPKFEQSETAIRQIEALGFSAKDVRHIVPTHFDLDHSGGIPDFPDAKVHMFAPEHQAATHPTTFFERHRYPREHLPSEDRWEVYELDGEPWFGFDTVRGLRGLPPEILLVPLVGHTRGHVGVAVDTGAQWLLHCGDAYFHPGDVRAGINTPIGLRVFQRLADTQHRARVENQKRLAELITGHPEVHAFCAHDAQEFEEFTNGIGDNK